MLRALPLLRVKLWCLASEVQEVALLLARYGRFNPTMEDGGPSPPAWSVEYREVYAQAEARMAKIAEYCGLDEPPSIPADAIAPNLRELRGINGRLREIWQACSACQENELRIAEERKRLATLEATYAHLKGLDVDLSRLLGGLGLLEARVGQVALANLPRLRDALTLAGQLMTVFDRDAEYAYAVVAGPRGREDVSGLLNQAGWRDLPVPPELQTHPEAARRYLAAERARLDALAGESCALRDRRRAQYGEWLKQARVLLILARPLAEAASAGLEGEGWLHRFTGWVPRRDLARLQAALEERFQGRYLLQWREPKAGEKLPTLLHHPAWLRPFAPLVMNYGVPRYGEFDPTLLFAVAYVLLFGAMFGDVGHGAVLFALFLLLRRTLGWVARVGLWASVSSIAFGVLYGSVFGNEEWLHPVWLSPMQDPVQLLRLAVYAGVGFIAVTLLLHAANRLAEGRWGAALFSPAGLAGLAFYLAIVAGLDAWFQGAGFPLAAGGVATAALALASAQVWVETRAPLGERILITFIESFEAIIGLFANTLSFLRVAAFSLNHAALALAVFTLANGMQAVGQGLTLVLGHLVILVLEGAIVAIQALRLMYYEGFSRFYSADGIEFRPLRLGGQSVV